jgi:hypothetical protein
MYIKYCVKPEWKRPLARSGHRWLDSIRKDHGVEHSGMGWIGLAHDREHYRVL